jgi:hypothetical protein
MHTDSEMKSIGNDIEVGTKIVFFFGKLDIYNPLAELNFK